MTTTALAPRAPMMALGSLEDPERLGTLLAKSGFFSDTRDAAQAVVKVLAGQELGFGPIASMTGVYIVKGRVTLSANLIAAAIQRHPKYRYQRLDHTAEVCRIEFFEGAKSLGISEFTLDMAKRAGLAGGESWRKYPEAMLFARALTAGARYLVPEVFSGAPMYTPDELDPSLDMDPDGGGVVVAEQASPMHFDPPSQRMVPDPPQPPAPAPPLPEPERPAPKPAPEPEPEPPSIAAESNGGNRDARVSDDEVAKLKEVFEARKVPQTFWQMALTSYGKDTLEELTRGEAHDMQAKASARFAG